MITGLRDFKTVTNGILEIKITAQVTALKKVYAAAPSAQNITIINTKSEIIFVRGSSLCITESSGKNCPSVMSILASSL